jgi:hypothetical protein
MLCSAYIPYYVANFTIIAYNFFSGTLFHKILVLPLVCITPLPTVAACITSTHWSMLSLSPMLIKVEMSTIKRSGEVKGESHCINGEDNKHKDGFTVEPQNHGVDQSIGLTKSNAIGLVQAKSRPMGREAGDLLTRRIMGQG